jgi:antitoxin component YwqK of YwqJK toxin-antitoxin module
MEALTHTSTTLPSYIRNPEEFIHKCLNDLFFFCTFVLRQKKKREYRDLNHIHRMLCDWLDRDPNPQKLNLMARDTFKSTIGRGKIIQEFLRLCVDKDEALLGIITGKGDLAEKHLQIITREILTNDYIQAYFRGYVPTKETEAESWNKEMIRWGRIGIDIGSEKRSLTGGHYDGIWTDNFMNELNSRTFDTCESAVEIWQFQESLLGPGSWELVSETPWRRNDVSGVILEPDEERKFNYTKLKYKAPALFASKTGYSVFSCFVRDRQGNLNFLPRLDETYLKRKRGKQGSFIYSRMYEGQIVDKESHPFTGLIEHYTEDPYNYIRTLAVDCSGTLGSQSTPSAISISDTDEHGVEHIAYADKRKVKIKDLRDWIMDLVEWCKEDGRPVTYVVIEKEKYGISLESIINEMDPDFYLWLVPLKGVPGPKRRISLQKYYENGKIKSKRGLKKYENEVEEYYDGRRDNVDIIDTVFLHFEVQLIPKKIKGSRVDEPKVDDSFKKQVERDLKSARGPLDEYVQKHF